MLVLENISDTAPHVFSNSTDGWVRLFENEGLASKATRRYDYSPALRGYARVRQEMGRRRKPSETNLPTPERYGIVSGDSMTSAARRAAYVGACMADSLLDPILCRAGAPFSTAHVGILFQRVA